MVTCLDRPILGYKQTHFDYFEFSAMLIKYNGPQNLDNRLSSSYN